MFNEKYINDFDGITYLKYLSDISSLKEIANAYINQFDNPTYDKTISFKESLDHFILKKIKSNPTFLDSNYFKNYLRYIDYIFQRRISTGNLHLEYNTNIIFTDSQVKEKILSYYNENSRNKIIELISQNEMKIEYVAKKIKDKQKLNQIEMDFIGEYLYTKKDLDSDLYDEYIEYLMNEMNNNPQISNSPRIIAAFIAYLPKVFGEGCENSRILLTNGYSSKTETLLPNVLDEILKQEEEKNIKNKTILNLRMYSSKDKYISISEKELHFPLTSDNSLDISRTSNIKDLYWISMVSFHELTHQKQTRKMKAKEFDSSGFGMIIKQLVNNQNDFIMNHDSYETEIEADENAWNKMYDFIYKFRYKKLQGADKDYALTQMKKCKTNKEAVYSRRTFLTKRTNNSNDNYFSHDMTIIFNNFKTIPGYKEYFTKMWESYPMLQIMFTKEGQLNTAVLLNENITSKDYTGLDNNILGSEIANYILDQGYQSLKKHVLNDSLTEEQIRKLMINIYNSYHLYKLYVQALSNVDLSQYKETKHNFNLDNIREKYLEKFKQVANLVYKERELVSIIKNRYPSYNVEQYANPKYAVWNYNDMFKYLYEASSGVLDYEELNNIISKYETSNDEVLLKLAQQTKSYFKPDENNIAPNLFAL